MAVEPQEEGDTAHEVEDEEEDEGEGLEEETALPSPALCPARVGIY